MPVETADQRLRWRTSLGERIRLARTQRSLSQAELAAWLSITQSQFSKTERGERELSFFEVVQLSGHLGLPLQWFLDGRLQPRGDRRSLIAELIAYGIRDLQSAGPLGTVGAIRSVEEVFCRSLEGRPDPRVLAALPALVLLNPIRHELLLAYATRLKVLRRSGFLCDLARHFHANAPWGQAAAVDFDEPQIIEFLKSARSALVQHPEDKAPKTASRHPIWKRWVAGLGITHEEFRDRCRSIVEEASRG
ncbi:MAG: helix-turn-helix transcriptional regulator [Planctomycetota bacterium]